MVEVSYAAGKGVLYTASATRQPDVDAGHIDTEG